MAAFEELQFRAYNKDNGGWGSWSKNLWGGYGGPGPAGGDSTGKYCVCIRGKAPQINAGQRSKTITIKIPFVRDDNTGNDVSTRATSGKFYIKCHGSTDPTGNGFIDSALGSNVYTVDWKSTDMNVHTVPKTMDYTGVTTEGTYYYFSIISDSIIEIGYRNYNSYWSLGVVGEPGASFSNFKDYGNNWCGINVSKQDGTDNAASVSEVNYSWDNKTWSKAVSYDTVNKQYRVFNNVTLTKQDVNATIYFQAKIKDSAGDYYTRKSSSYSFKRFAGPTKPKFLNEGKAIYKGTKLTNRGLLSYQWATSKKFNDNCSGPYYAVKLELVRDGSRRQLLIGKSDEKYYDSWGSNSPDSLQSGLSYNYSKLTDTCEFTINPREFNVTYTTIGTSVDVDKETVWGNGKFKKGDRLRLCICAWSADAANNRMYNGTSDSTWTGCVNSNGSYVSTPPYIYSSAADSGDTLESAGVVRVKRDDGAWVEGQVWLYTEQGWVEADSIYVKTADTNSISDWKESI